MRLVYKFLTNAMCAVIILNCGAAYSDIVPPSQDMRFIVDSIDEYGLIVSSTGEKFRIFGIVPESTFAAFVKENLVGKELHCDNAGATGTKTMLIFDEAVKSIDCSPTNSAIGRSPPLQYFSSLQEELIDAGVALEYCPESRNHFKTCRVKQE